MSPQSGAWGIVEVNREREVVSRARPHVEPMFHPYRDVHPDHVCLKDVRLRPVETGEHPPRLVPIAP